MVFTTFYRDFYESCRGSTIFLTMHHPPFVFVARVSCSRSRPNFRCTSSRYRRFISRIRLSSSEVTRISRRIKSNDDEEKYFSVENHFKHCTRFCLLDFIFLSFVCSFYFFDKCSHYLSVRLTREIPGCFAREDRRAEMKNRLRIVDPVRIIAPGCC